MRTACLLAVVALVAGGTLGTQATADAICQGYGPQAPRDIASRTGTNTRVFTLAPPASQMNLCSIHFHANAEHKAPGFSLSRGRASTAAIDATRARA